MIQQISAGGLRFGINSTRLKIIEVMKAASNEGFGIETVLNAIFECDVHKNVECKTIPTP